MMKHVLIDCDTGIDDSIAILYALKNKHIHIEGITTGFGNATALQAADNTLRLIKLAQCGYEIPVAVGAEQPLHGERESAPVHIHGHNGIGDAELPPSDQKVLAEPAWDFIIRKANELKGNLIIVTLGRLTNLALALEKDPELPCKVKKVVSMGGSSAKPGNVSQYAEANIYGDAEAADIVVKAGFNLTLVGLDVTTETFITGNDLEALSHYCAPENKPIVEYMQSALRYYFKFHYATAGLIDRCYVHDPLAMILAVNPSLGSYNPMSVQVEFCHPELRGMIKMDNRFISEYLHDEILYCTHVDSDLAVRKLLSAF